MEISDQPLELIKSRMLLRVKTEKPLELIKSRMLRAGVGMLREYFAEAETEEFAAWAIFRDKKSLCEVMENLAEAIDSVLEAIQDLEDAIEDVELWSREIPNTVAGRELSLAIEALELLELLLPDKS